MLLLAACAPPAPESTWCGEPLYLFCAGPCPTQAEALDWCEGRYGEESEGFEHVGEGTCGELSVVHCGDFYAWRSWYFTPGGTLVGVYDGYEGVYLCGNTSSGYWHGGPISCPSGNLYD